MRVAIFDVHPFELKTFSQVNAAYGHELKFFETQLNMETAQIAAGFPCVCSFVNDRLDKPCLIKLKEQGTKLVALRSAGFNHVDLSAAQELGLPIVRVPEYSPYAVAEHAVGLMLVLNRKLHRAFNRVRELNFSLNGLVGFDMHGKTVGIVGTGRIGSALAHIVHGFGCNILAYDLSPTRQLEQTCNIKYVELPELLKKSDIVSLHVPLTRETHHMINDVTLASMQKGVMLVNTSRGGLIDTKALIDALKHGVVGAAGLDVYEEEAGVFFEDHSQDLLQDDVLARLLTFPNVFITSHQAFLTQEALTHIAETTLQNISDFESGKTLINEVH